MAGSSSTFSESWHRVADLRVGLRSTVSVRKQYFRGELWYVLSDKFSNKFFRLRPEAYEYVSRLRVERTVESVWNECLNRDPDGAPGQEDVIRLLTQLHFSNILYFEASADIGKIFERYENRRQREIRSKLMSIMFMRLPVWDPEIFLRRMLPVINRVVSPSGAILWLVAVFFALKTVIERSDGVMQQAQAILAPNNLIFLYIGLVIIKTLHELGHAAFCRRFGGEVHTMGVMLLVFTPLPYMDATSSWTFRSRWKRALVGGAGMIVEIFVASMAVFVWAHTAPGALNSVAYNMMFIASVSTILFNANPLLRFDGYYILSDLLDIPNLHTRASGHLRHLVERYAFGYKDSSSPTDSMKEAVWLTVFGIASSIYRVIVFAGIIFFVADKFLLAGVLMAVICVVSWVFVPLFKFVSYLSSSPRLARSRPRAILASLLFFSVIFAFFGIIPFPNHFKVPGILEAEAYVKVINDAEGYVAEVLTPTGSSVNAGDVLLSLSNQTLEYDIKVALAQRQETAALLMQAKSVDKAALMPIEKRLNVIDKKIGDLYQEQSNLMITARQPGIWVAPETRNMNEAWLRRGSTIGEIIDARNFRFSAVVSQEKAADLFENEIRKSEVRIHGQGGITLAVTELQMIPFQHERLPSRVLGWTGGGDVAVSMDESGQAIAKEPFFMIYAQIEELESVALLHGRSGKLRLSLPNKPLLVQLGGWLRQILQKRYQL